MALILAILWAQFKSIRVMRAGSGRSGAIFSALTSVLWYGFWAGAAFGVYAVVVDPSAPDDLYLILPALFIFVILYWQLAPVLVASLGASLDLKKLLAYPIPTSSLFWVEVMLRITTGIEMILLLIGAGTGLLRNASARPAGLPNIVAALLAFMLFNLLLAAGVRGLIERILGRKRLREVFVLLLVMIAALPQLLIVTGVPKGSMQRLISRDSSVLWPWMAETRLLVEGFSLAPWAVLIACTIAAYLFGRWQFESNLRFDIQAAQATPAGPAPENSWSARFYGLPSLVLPDPTAAIVEKELRTLTRTPRFRLVFIMGFTFGLVVWLPLMVGARPGHSSAAVDNFLTLVCLYALALLGQVTYWNAFGFDRSAAQAYWVLPPPLSRALIGKNLAAGIFVVLEVVFVSAASMLLQMEPSVAKVAEAFIVTPIVALYLLAAGNLSSVYMPRPLSAERVAQGGSAGRSQAFMLFVYPLALGPVLIAYGARYAFESEAVFYSLLAFAAALGCVVYWIALDSAVKAADRKREQIITELSRAEGPVATE